MVMEPEVPPMAGELEASVPGASPEPSAPSTDAATLSAEVSAAPQEAVPSASAPTPPSPTVPEKLSPELQEYVTRLEGEARAAREQGDLQVLSQVTAQYAKQLEERYGLAPEQAQILAKEQGDIVYKQYQATQLQKAQVRAAISIAQEFGVDPLQLLDLPSPQAMRQAAQVLSGTTKQALELAQLRAEIAKLKKATVPAQTFTQGAQPGAGAGLAGDALEAAWLKHETTQPDRPNPYDSAYRAMLRG